LRGLSFCINTIVYNPEGKLLVLISTVNVDELIGVVETTCPTVFINCISIVA